MEKSAKTILKFYKKYYTYADYMRQKGYLLFIVNNKINDKEITRTLILKKKFSVNKTEQKLIKNKMPPTIEVFDESAGRVPQSYKSTNNTSWLLINNIHKLLKFKKQFSEAADGLEMIKASSNNDFDIYNNISKEGFLTQSADCPYEEYDDESFNRYLQHKIQTQTTETDRAFLLKFKDSGEYFGCISVAINKKTAFISGFTILPKFRRTRAFLCVNLFLKYLLNEKVNTIFCTTKTDGYPEKIYKKMGFKRIFATTVFMKTA